MCVSCLPQLSVDGQTVTTGRGYPDVRSVRIEREDILYGYAAQPSTPLRVLLISAPLTGSIIHSEPESKVDTSGRALLLLAHTQWCGEEGLWRCLQRCALFALGLEGGSSSKELNTYCQAFPRHTDLRLRHLLFILTSVIFAVIIFKSVLDLNFLYKYTSNI